MAGPARVGGSGAFPPYLDEPRNAPESAEEPGLDVPNVRGVERRARGRSVPGVRGIRPLPTTANRLAVGARQSGEKPGGTSAGSGSRPAA